MKYAAELVPRFELARRPPLLPRQGKIHQISVVVATAVLFLSTCGSLMTLQQGSISSENSGSARHYYHAADAFVVPPRVPYVHTPRATRTPTRSGWGAATAFSVVTSRNSGIVKRWASVDDDTSSKIKASSLEQDLNAAEKTVVGVVRTTGSSVALVTSFALPPPSVSSGGRMNGRGSRGKGPNKPTDSSAESLPRGGQSLGSGSGFVVDRRGYIVTNYHVIEPAYQLQQMARQYNAIASAIIGNLTLPLRRLAAMGSTANDQSQLDNAVDQWVNETLLTSQQQLVSRAEVYVRIDSKTKYQKCRIVNVQPELDVAVLKIIDSDVGDESDVSLAPLSFGSSSNLLVGQSLIAIGNPFGFDNTVTTGVVSALDRELALSSIPRRRRQRPGPRSIASNKIRNCIQTDCAINPGNSGGPLLNLQGQVVGVTTAIVTTSGSNAGIGFAIPADQVQPVVASMIRRDVQSSSSSSQRATATGNTGGNRQPAWLGVSILQGSAAATAIGDSDFATKTQMNWVATVSPKSPADLAGIQGIDIDDSTLTVCYGDAIVAVGGNALDLDHDRYASLQLALERCVVGEQLALTLLNGRTGERRVVYVTLTARPY